MPACTGGCTFVLFAGSGGQIRCGEFAANAAAKTGRHREKKKGRYQAAFLIFERRADELGYFNKLGENNQRLLCYEYLTKLLNITWTSKPP